MKYLVALIPIAAFISACDSAEPAHPNARPAPVEANDPGSPAAQFVGTFKHVGAQAEVEARDAAIDGVVGQMGMLSRGIARDRLKESNPVASTISVSADQGSVTIAMDDRSYTAPLDGTPVKVKGITGDELDLSVKIGDGLEQTFSGDEKGRINSMRIENNRLILTVVVHAEALPTKLTYTLTYERA
ncbi:MAG: hypothetical protein HOW73_47285 [Polyangiaceae bacterium]|nr:hypothetical protein [Polyangiaceae bacterium]